MLKHTKTRTGKAIKHILQLYIYNFKAYIFFANIFYAYNFLQKVFCIFLHFLIKIFAVSRFKKLKRLQTFFVL